MKKYPIILGIDVGKESLSVCIFRSAQVYETRDLANEAPAFEELLAWLRTWGDPQEAVFCMEHTGVYTYRLIDFLEQHGLAYTLIPSIQIQQSMGLQRAKTDPSDAQKIAQYVYRFADQVPITRLPERALRAMQLLQAHRQRLIKIKGQLKNPIQELEQFADPELSALIGEPTQEILALIHTQLRAIERQIQQIVNAHLSLKTQFQLITSVTGVGKVTAWYVLVVTQGFTRMQESRQLSCFAGTAPFPYQSGKRIKKPDRISSWGNTQLKTFLSNCVISAMTHDRELRAYYDRKLKEGKSKACIYNAMRNKILARICAVVKRGTPYVKGALYYS